MFFAAKKLINCTSYNHTATLITSLDVISVWKRSQLTITQNLNLETSFLSCPLTRLNHYCRSRLFFPLTRWLIFRNQIKKIRLRKSSVRPKLVKRRPRVNLLPRSFVSSVSFAVEQNGTSTAHHSNGPIDCFPSNCICSTTIYSWFLL